MVARRVLAVAALCAAASAKDLNVPMIPIKVANGGTIDMPAVGLGTWLYNSSRAAGAVEMAIKLGYRMIDTASMYGNQDGVAKGIAASGVPTSKLFISTKVPGGLNESATMAAVDENLKLLGVKTVDLTLTHFPCSMDGKNCNKAERQATWRGLEAAVAAGKTRAIGVSHYCQQHLDDVLEIASVPISLDQEEWHVGMGPDPQGIKSYAAGKGIIYASFSPLCGPCSEDAKKEIFDGLTATIGKKYKKSGSQVALKWLLQQKGAGPVIPKSDTEAHQLENIDLFDFELSAADMAQLDAATSPASVEPVSDDCKLKMTAMLV